MNFIIDAHAHLSSEEYLDEEIAIIIEEARISNVGIIIDVAYDIKSCKKVFDNCISYENVYGIIGIHPDEANNVELEDLKKIENLIRKNRKIVGVGEIGLDYFHMVNPKKIQKEIFIKQLKIAKKFDLAVAIHLRDQINNYDAYKDCLKILKDLNIKKGQIHCFLGTYDLAIEFIKQGFYISFSGVITFKNAKNLEDVVKRINLSSILVETDCPYLSPVPYRGHINYPKYINYTVRKIANLKKLPLQEVINQTNYNTLKLFDIKK